MDCFPSGMERVVNDLVHKRVQIVTAADPSLAIRPATVVSYDFGTNIVALADYLHAGLQDVPLSAVFLIS